MPGDTKNLIEKLRAIADALEIEQEAFPDISWYRALHTTMWNGGITTVDKTGCFYEICVDYDNIGRSTDISVGIHTAGAYVDIGPVRIGTLRILGLDMCTLDHTRKRICNVVAELPEHLRLPVYKRMAQIRMEARRKKKEQIDELETSLRELKAK
ncbi:MAG: hypothetical protein GY832_11335 [Chloroflexi bacterium]|nr:hypothetical protein [Chloroflexota bacterium]